MKIPDNLRWKSTGRTLGSGGQGDVQLVVDKDDLDGRKYALKTLRNVGSPQALQRFQREIEVIQRLSHPSIVPIVNYSESGSTFQYYVMEYYEGARTLASVIFSPDSPYQGNVGKCLDLLEQILRGLAVCEVNKVVHRDIKPQNVLVLQDDTIRIIDFGICQFDNGELLTLVDENVGPRNYTAPECEAGTGGQIGAHSDIYSAGKILWSAITSQQSFARERPVFSNKSMLKMFPKTPETWHLMLLFEKIIRRDPADRLQDAMSVLFLMSDLKAVIENGFPPLEKVRPRCPSCGWNKVERWGQGHTVFGSGQPYGGEARRLICNYCGFAFVRDVSIWERNAQRWADME